MTNRGKYSRNYIRKLRNKQGLTLQELADIVGTSNQQVSNHESEKRRITIEWLWRYAKALNCHPVEIIQLEEHTPKNIDEKALLEKYRELNAEDRKTLIRIMDALCSSNQTIINID